MSAAHLNHVRIYQAAKKAVHCRGLGVPRVHTLRPHGVRRTAVCRASEEGESWNNPKFGVPMAPREYWEKFQREARAGFLEEMNEGGDPLMAALHLAAEDDAVETKSTVDLPVTAYSKRVDSLVQQLSHSLDDNTISLDTPEQTIEYCTTFLFDNMGYKVAERPLELYSPYRVYMHRVLAQRCGTPEALGSLLVSFVKRVQAKGLAPSFTTEVGLAGPGVLPCLRVTDSDTSKPSVRWVPPRETVVLCLDTLKRSTWSWVWTLGAPECFRVPAEAFLGQFGRAGVGSGVVGVMQATGRPFGSLPMALLHTQRLAILRKGLDGGRQGARHVRDTGILLCHLGRFDEAKTALEGYSVWLKDNTTPADLPTTVVLPKSPEEEAPIDPVEVDLVDKLLLKLTALTLEKVYTSS